MKKQPATLRAALVGAVLRAVAILCLFVGGFLIVTTFAPTGASMAPSHPDAIEKPTAKGSPAWFIEKYDCWTGEAPADMQGKFPGHVIVTEGGRTFRGGPTKVSTALDHIFKGTPTEIETIHAFCR